MTNLVAKVLKQPSLAFYRFRCLVFNEIEDVYRAIAQKHIWSEIINQKEIRVVGLRRCGNHAVINWLQKQAQGEVWHLNNIIANQNPYRYKYQNLSYYFPQHKWAKERFKQQAQGQLTHKDCLLYSYEDYELNKIFTQTFENKHDLYLGKSQTRYDVLIIRDPFNLFASRLKNNYLSVRSKRNNIVNLWLDYAKEYLGETNYLKHNKLCINYNRWTKEIDYRQQIAAAIGLEFSDAGINTVHGCGGGSSFDGRALDGQAKKMDIHNRWKHFIDNKTYRQLFNNQQLLDYSQRIFGHIPGTEVLFDR